jgi:hypothetical protein
MLPNIKSLDLSEAWDESRSENERERDVYRLCSESTVELYKLLNTLEKDSAMPAKPGGSDVADANGQKIRHLESLLNMSGRASSTRDNTHVATTYSVGTLTFFPS